MKKNIILALTAVLLWATLSPANKILLTAITPMELLFVTSLLAILLLAVLISVTGRLSVVFSLRAKDWGILTLLGLLGTFLYSWFFNLGLNVLEAQQACIINYLWPMLAVMFSCLILHERLTLRSGIAIGLSFLGVAAVVGLQAGTLEGISIPGVLSVAAAAVCYGLFSALNKQRQYDQYVAMFWYFLVTAAAAFVVLLCRRDLSVFSDLNTPLLWGAAAWVGFLCNAVAYTCWCIALLRGETSRIANLAYLTPVVTMLLSCLLLGEDFSLSSVVGLALILLGIFLQLRDGKRKQ